MSDEATLGFIAPRHHRRARYGDNGSAYRSHAFRKPLADAGTAPYPHEAHTPRINGKAERFIQASLRLDLRMTHQEIDVVILAGGKGTRLQTVVSDLPKPMAPVNGRPFLDYRLAQLARAPLVDKVVLSLGHLAGKVISHYGDTAEARRLHFVVEDKPLGTAGAVRNSLPATTSELVLVMNGDSIFDR